VTNAWLPEGVDWKAFDRALLERNLVIAGGQGKLAGKTLRVGHLGDVDIDDILAVFSVLEEVMLEFGLPVTPGSGVAAAERAGLEVAGEPSRARPSRQADPVSRPTGSDTLRADRQADAHPRRRAACPRRHRTAQGADTRSTRRSAARPTSSGR
jgi:hypothetical protein